MSILFLLLSAIVAWLLWVFVSLLANYSSARHIGLPIIISPVNSLNPIWILTQRCFPIVSLCKLLPFGLGTWARCSYMGWTFQDKYAVHNEFGNAFTLVTPSRNEIILADPEAAHGVLSRRKEYIKPAEMYAPLNIFGPNLDTVEGEDWQRHRRLTAPSFNEKSSSLVWSEALRQAQDMLKSWTEQGKRGTQDTARDTAKLALHVITSAGFGVSYAFDADSQPLPSKHSLTYSDALSLVLRNFILLAIFPLRLLNFPFSPKPFRKVGQAAQEFREYMEQMVVNERAMISKRESGTGNLMSALVRASEEDKLSSKTGGPSQGLNADEILGNAFIFAMAGHETTANAIAAALVLLAANPTVQDWLAEEINNVSSGDDTNYETLFPKLNRCMAVMLETLRLYGSIVFIPKSTGSHAQTLQIKDTTHPIPPNTFIYTNSQALHCNPHSWGPDVLTWNPKRWITPSSAGHVGAETLIEPQQGTFIPWADGPRLCPGRKFAQVEFVAVMKTLFRDHRVQAVLKEGEDEESGKTRLLQMIDDSAIFAITLQMQNPRSVGLRWVKK